MLFVIFYCCYFCSINGPTLLKYPPEYTAYFFESPCIYLYIYLYIYVYVTARFCSWSDRATAFSTLCCDKASFVFYLCHCCSIALDMFVIPTYHQRIQWSTESHNSSYLSLGLPYSLKPLIECAVCNACCVGRLLIMFLV